MINMGHASFFMSISKMFSVQIVTFLDTNKRIEYNVAFKIKIYPLMLLGKNHPSHFIVCTEFLSVYTDFIIQLIFLEIINKSFTCNPAIMIIDKIN